MNASTFTARVIASTGADVAAALSGAVGALSGPLHGGAPSRVLKMLDDVERQGDAERYVKDALDRGERLMGFGHRVYRAEDPRARVLRRTAREVGVASASRSPRRSRRRRWPSSQARKPDRVLATNVEFWSAVVLDTRRGPAGALHVACSPARASAGWSAHILEQKREGAADPPDGEVRRPAAAAAVGPAVAQSLERALRGCRAARAGRPRCRPAELLRRRRAGDRRSTRAARAPSSVSASSLTRRSCSAGRRSTRPRYSSRSTMPVTLELSQPRIAGELAHRARGAAGRAPSARRAAAARARTPRRAP